MAQKGLYTGITQAGFPVGLLLANLAFLGSVPLGPQWAWRVPFLLSASSSSWASSSVSRSRSRPEFEELKEEGDVAKNPLTDVIRDRLAHHPARLLPARRRDRGYAVSVTFMLSYLATEGSQTAPLA